VTGEIDALPGSFNPVDQLMPVGVDRGCTGGEPHMSILNALLAVIIGQLFALRAARLARREKQCEQAERQALAKLKVEHTALDTARLGDAWDAHYPDLKDLATERLRDPWIVASLQNWLGMPSETELHAQRAVQRAFAAVCRECPELIAAGGPKLKRALRGRTLFYVREGMKEADRTWWRRMSRRSRGRAVRTVVRIRR
jgi:hypothetical protein